jgi:hypothetical protein
MLGALLRAGGAAPRFLPDPILREDNVLVYAVSRKINEAIATSRNGVGYRRSEYN